MLAFACILCGNSAMAQYANSGYFVDGYVSRHQLNPAFGNEKGYVSMPGLSNVSVSQRGSIGVRDIFYNSGGKTVTFMHPDIDAATALSKFGDKESVGANLKYDILSVGFKAFGGYNALTISTRSNAAVQVPYDLFRLLKQGAESDSYDISDFRAHADGYAEIALNHSRQIGKNIRIGGTLKLLVGAGNVDAEFNQAQLRLTEDAWTVVTDAQVQSSIANLRYTSEMSEQTGNMHVTNVDVDKAGVAGYGAAIDLGAAVTLGDFEVSAALLDFGFINWKNNYLASTDGTQTFSTDKYSFNVDDDATNNFEDEFDLIGDEIAKIYELKDMGDQGSRMRMLASTINVGAKYTLPAYKKLCFGLLATARLQSSYSWFEARGSVNYSPCSWFAMSVSGAAGNNGAGLGWMLSLHPKGFSLFAGMDYTCLKLAKPGIPENNSTTVNIGINFPF